MRVDQYLPSIVPHDAISNHTLQLRKALRAAGYQSDIYAEAIGGPLRREARPGAEAKAAGARPAGERAVIYHASTDSDMAGWLASIAAGGEVLLADYHNITPASFFARWLPDVARHMEVAREQLAELAPAVRLGMADSRYNEEELIELGYRRTATCPLLVDLSEYHQAPDHRALARLRRARDRGGARWLFVGRLSPNKCQHDVIAAFAVYRRLFDPKAHLTLVGGGTAPRYITAVRQMMADLELGDSVELLDGVGFPVLLAQFAAADVFVCLSEHEGFCVPVLEAMELGVPVVAYAAAAVPDTVGDAGVLLADKDPLTVAVEVDGVLGDESRRLALIAAGRARAASFSLERTAPAQVAAVASALAA